jgi:hypothetical protein
VREGAVGWIARVGCVVVWWVGGWGGWVGWGGVGGGGVGWVGWVSVLVGMVVDDYIYIYICYMAWQL